MFTPFIEVFERLFEPLHLSEYFLKVFSQGTTFLAMFAASMLFYFVAWFLIRRTIIALIQRSENDYDDILIKNKVISRTSYLLPAYLINRMVSFTMPDFPNVSSFIQETIEVYVIIMVIFIVMSLINSVHEIYNSFEVSKNKPIKGLIQVIKIVVYIVGTLMTIASLLDRDLGTLFLGLGTLSAVLMLVFKDAILGFVGGLQLSLNDMVRLGDWISMPKFGADGEVLDITLTTVKVQNFDKTITTIPTYSMVSDYFTNWRGMQESGGRRVKRHVLIDMESVQFCDSNILKRLQGHALIEDIIDELLRIEKLDPVRATEISQPTNLGVFRTYLTRYLMQLPQVHNEMPVLVRQLQATPTGLPLEVYLFSNQQGMIEYENLQSDIFDHILAILPDFGLRVYQATTSFKQGV
jgi:miniconductance mechanosensitive channel